MDGSNIGGGEPQKPARPAGIPWEAAVISNKPGRIARLLHMPWPRKVRRSIDVEFTSDEKDFDGVGDRAGSYKGGTIGCRYQMKPGEMPVDTLRRMQRERKF